jgi:hypothetical protein
MKNTKLNWAINRRLLTIIALVAVIGFSFIACDNGNMEDDKTGIDTTALDAVLLDAGKARDGVMSAEDAEEVPTGRKWATQSEWDAFDAAYKKAAETKANPSSQAAVDKAKADLQAALNTFNAAKKNGTGAAIKLSGTITVKNNGQIVPYVQIAAITEDWTWIGTDKINSTVENTPWEMIIKPFDSPTNIFFRITGFDNDKYENVLFNIDIEDDKVQVFKTDVPNININKNLNLITISGTFNFDYNGKTVPSVSIQTNLKDGGFIGGTDIVNAGKNTPWSMTIPAQTDKEVIFNVWGFDGPLAWEYDELFFLGGIDLGVTVKDQNIPNIAINLITVSGTINVTYNGSPVPLIWLHFDKKVDDNNLEWICGKALDSPSSGSLWSVIIPAYTSDTEIVIGVSGGQNEVWDGQLFGWKYGETITVKNTNVSGIVLDVGDFITISGTVSVTYNGNPVPIVEIAFETDTDWLGSTRLYNPSPNAPWSYIIPAFTSDTEVYVDVILKDEDDEDLIALWGHDTITVKDTNITGIVLNPGNITDD